MTLIISSTLGVALVLLGAVLFMHIRSRHQYRTQIEALDGRLRTAHHDRDGAESRTSVAESLRAWFQDLFLHSPQMVMAYTISCEGTPGEFVAVNDTACRVLEYSRDELLSMSPMDIETFRQPDTRDRQGDVDFMSLSNVEALGSDSAFARRNMQMLVKQTLQSGETTYEGGYVTKQGHLIPTRVTAQRMDLGTESRIVIYAQDITSERNAEKTLAEADQQLRELMANSVTGVAIYDGHRHIRRVNAACLKIFGCPDQSEFEKFGLLDSHLLPDTVRGLINSGEFAHFEIDPDFDAVLTGGHMITTRTGTAHLEVWVVNLGVNTDYSPRGYLVQVQDVTYLREAELTMSQMERQLLQAQKMEAIGTLAGGIAHDFNNMLTPILGFSELGIEASIPGSDLSEFFEEIRTSSRRAKQLVEQILIFSRRGERAGTPINLIPIVKEVTKQIASSAAQGVTVQCSVRADEALVLATPTQIHQALTNLCSNAAYVLQKHGGLIEISLSTFVLGHRHRSEFPQLATRAYLRGDRKARYVRLSVRDTGPGMDPDTADRIFEPFFTTKPTGEGTGMGLPLVQSIVTSLDGAVSVDSRPGEGTAFSLVMPLVEVEKEEVEAFARTTPVKGTGSVLFVDDEPAILRMAERMLASIGYRAVVSGSGGKALTTFKENPSSFDLVITDHVMPGMTGAELTAKLIEIRPDIPVVMCTGFTDRFSPDKAREIGIREFVMKPMEKKDLAVAIERALATRKPFPPDLAETPVSS